MKEQKKCQTCSSDILAEYFLSIILRFRNRTLLSHAEFFLFGMAVDGDGGSFGNAAIYEQF